MKNKKRLALIVCLILIAIGTVIYFAVPIPRFRNKTYELGNVEISDNATDYLFASSANLSKTKVDISKVNIKAVGDYEITCDFNGRIIKYDIHIVDTTKPEIKKRVDKKYGNQNEYSVEDVVDITDLSQIKESKFISCKSEDGKDITFESDKICFENVGKYTIGVETADVYGNTATFDAKIDVLESPHFVMLADRKYRINTRVRLKDAVFAEDKDGNNISSRIVVEDDGGYNNESANSYDITYSVTDYDDVKRTQTITIEVGSFDENDYGVDKNELLQAMVDYDIYSYEPLSNNDDYDKVVELTSPSSFSIKYDTERSYGMCTCFLVDVTQSHLYYITCEHCASFFSKYGDYTIFDYEGKTNRYSPSDTVVYKSDNRDLLCFEVPIEKTNMEDLFYFKKVLIDYNIYDEMKEGDKLLLNTQEFGMHLNAKHNDICKEVTLYSTNRDSVGDFKFSYPSVSTNEGVLKGGQSGSPLFDYNGHLIGVAESIYWDKSRKRADAYARIDGILELMKKVEIR